MSAVPPVGWEQIDLDPASLELFEFTAYGPVEVMESLASLHEIDPQGVLLASSASHAHFCFGAALAGPGGTVVHEVPGYFPLVDALSVVGVQTVPFERRFEDQYHLDTDRLADTVGKHKAKLVLITNIHNPSGVQLSKEEEAGLVSLCEQHDCHVIVDEMYRPFLDPDPGPLSRLHPSIISIGGLNKVHGVSQVRIGWGLSTRELVDRARCVFDSTTLHNSCLTDQVARAAMQRWEPLRQRGRKFAVDGWQIFSEWVQKQPLSLVEPAGGVVCFPKVPERFGADGVEFRRKCMEQDVNLTPGYLFGASDHVRIGFGLPVDELRRALSALEKVLSE